MTDPNNITPPPGLVQQWTNSAHLSQPNMGAICREVATQASRWGGDQELEACIQLMLDKGWITQSFAENLRTARRPKQPSLKEKALKALDAITTNFHVHEPDAAAVRRALEQLPDGPAVTPAADDPAPTADGVVPLWKLMRHGYDQSSVPTALAEQSDPETGDCLTDRYGYAAELRVVADWIDRKAGYDTGSASWLRAEADRAEDSH